MRIKAGHPGQTAINDRADAIDGERGFGHIGRHDDALLFRGAHGQILLRSGKLAVERAEDKSAPAAALLQSAQSALNLVGAGHENEDVALATSTPGHELFHGFCRQIPHRCFGRFGQVFHGHGEGAARRLHDRARFEVRGKDLRFQRGGHDDQLQIGPHAPLDLTSPRQGDIAFQMAFMEFVKDDHTYPWQGFVFLHLAQEDPLRDIEDARLLRGDVFQAILVAHLLAQIHAALFCHALGQQPGGDPARLEHDDAAILCASEIGQPIVQEKLRHLGRFPRSGGGLKNNPSVRAKGLGQFRTDLADGQSGHGAGDYGASAATGRC